jgi:hypothetical protein
MARLDFFERFVVVDKLRRVVEIDQQLSVAVGEKSIDCVSVFGPFEINEHLDELIEREYWNVDLKDHTGG